jgi:transcriptional regulator with XRE-family HTH domain
MDVLEKIRRLKLERHWTEYQLAEKSGLTQSTISSWYRNNTQPTIASLECICKAFNMTLSQFFAENKNENQTLTETQTAMLDEWNRLSGEQQYTLLCFLKTL